MYAYESNSQYADFSRCEFARETTYNDVAFFVSEVCRGLVRLSSGFKVCFLMRKMLIFV